MIELWGWVSSEITPHMETVYSLVSAPSLPPVQTTVPSDDQTTSWWWQFSTGPALGGVLALGAAVLAFIRIGHQVAATKVANTETARKNSEEQWWDTLKWTYTEAKDSKTNSGPFQEVAAVRILESLNHEHDQLTVQQKEAIESIRDIFGQSQKPEVLEAVAPLYQSFGRISPQTYENDFLKVLGALNIGDITVETADGDGYDLLLKSGAKSVVIELRHNSAPVQPSIAARIVARLVQGIANSPDPKNTAGLLVTMNGVSTSTNKIIAEASERVSLATVPWSPGENPAQLKEVLTGLLKGN